MLTDELLSTLTGLGYRLCMVGDKLRIEGAAGAELTPELRQAVKEHKDELCLLLRRTETTSKRQRLDELHERIDYGRILLNEARTQGREWPEGLRQLEALEAEYAALTDDPFSDKRILLAAKRQELVLHQRLAVTNPAWWEATKAIQRCVDALEAELQGQPLDALPMEEWVR